MKLTIRALILLPFCLSAAVGFSQASHAVQPDKVAHSPAQSFLDFDLAAASESAEQRLHRAPNDVEALFARMETAELQERPELVLDSALRLCNLDAAPELHEVASNRVLQHAANTLAFNAILRRLKAAAVINNDCTLNLRLALVAAATDGTSLDLDQVTHASGLLTHWQIAGPFGHYNNVDFERRWQPEEDRFLQQQYSTEQMAAPQKSAAKAVAPIHPDPAHMVAAERFWFRDGMVSLPEYFPSSGIFYAAGEVEVTSAARTQIDVLSPGAYEVFVDGKSALLHDSRYAAGASRDSNALQLTVGHHRILVKFTADAAPLSVAVHPQFQRVSQRSSLLKPSSLPQHLGEYTREMIAYFHGDFIGMDRLLNADSSHQDGYAQYMRALLYSAAEDHSPRSDAAWKAVAAVQPSALLARLRSAENAMERGQNEAAHPDVMSILAERPQSETALQLAFSLSRSNQVDAPVLLSRLLELHPSCSRLTEAVKFYNSTAEQDKARSMEQQLATCAPESLQYARVLSESGRHSAAAAYLQQIVTRNPFHRAARRFLVDQLTLDNQLSAAKLQATQLRELAINARNYRRLAEEPVAAQDSKSQRADGFTQGEEFYVPYRRDGLELVRKSAQRTFSGGAAVILLSDKAIFVQRNGPVSVYVHRITRPLNKEGITRYGEVSLPRGADLLELRTIKSTGEVIEPELAQQKPTISMPALEPGDAIEEEYVMHYSEVAQLPESASAHTFGSFAAPILYSRLVLMNPSDARIRVHEQVSPPQPLVGENNGMVIRIWERNNIAQTLAESYLPSVNLLPTITVVAAEKTYDGLRDELMEATRVGLHVNAAVTGLHLAQNLSETEKAKRLYRFVTEKIDSTGPEWADSPAEDALSAGQGSRTTALLALAHSAGIKAELLLAHRIDQHCGKEHDSSCYSEPLVRFSLSNNQANTQANNESVDVDAESDDLPFGATPPSLDPRDALLVSLLPDEEKKLEVVTLPGRMTDEKSVAEGELSFHDSDLVADIQVQLGSVRAQEVRSMLRNASERERQAFFEQLAMRIFPGATAVTGSAAHENDPEQPLKLSLHCTAPQFINRQAGTAEIDQLAPALGLAALYAKTPTRKFPLYIDSLFFESTVFHLHLLAGMEVRSLPADFAGKNEFGEYALRFVRLPHQVDIHRDFKVPVQVVAQEKYAAFVNFAGQIDEAERQRISLEVMKNAANDPVHVKQ